MPDKEPKVVEAADLIDEVLNEPHYVSVDDTHIVINVEYPYEISISDCDSRDKILGWMVHLCEKTWITPSVLREFAYKAASAAGVELPHN